MIISFSVENWMSFRHKVTLSMVGTRERQHGQRISRVDKYRTRILPVAAIYGGNASGKTNFFKALHFAKTLVVKGARPESLLPVEPFRLDRRCVEQPSRFEFVLLIDDVIYDFSFTVNRKAVLEERLILVTSTSEKVLYNRHGDQPDFDQSLAKNVFLKFAFEGTRSNQLFLTNSVSQKVTEFQPIYTWFKHNVELVAPDSRFEMFEHFFDDGHVLYNTMNETLPQLDTGIAHLGGEDIPFENIPFPEPVKTVLLEEVKEGMSVRLLNAISSERFVVSRKGGELIARKLVTYHSRADGSETKFELRQESDGSQRVIDLLPAFLDLSAQVTKKVYVIDELDRSLHTLLTRRLLEMYLGSCSDKTRSQLLFTTHDVLLMDQQLLRRDEMWITDRDSAGVSGLRSFSDYKDVRNDKDVRKSYLQGRLGGIPRIP